MASLKDDYELLNSFIVQKTILVEKYQHKKTKLTIYNATTEGPLTNGYIFLPTETLSNDGCPHTLEHLIFLGSEDYPFKGFLDMASNKCFASGTNAYTDTDHTAYELETAGSDGFLQILPIFLDHIIYPTITEESFVTEVHHINGKGENGGVVYCEMQERENKRGAKVFLSVLKELFTSPSGYRSEIGGLMEDIRNLKVQTIREFHKSFYRPDNTAVVVIGNVNIEDIFKSIEPMQQKFISKGQLTPMEKPWSSKLDIFAENKTTKVIFPSEEETTGECVLTFKGSEFSNFDLNDSLIILSDYLINGSTSPIGSTMIDIEDSYAPNIFLCPLKFSTKFYGFWFENCDLKRIASIKDKFISVLKDLVDNKIFDLERIRDSILQNKLNLKLQFEKKANKTISEIVIGDYLYGSNNFEEQMDCEIIFEKLLSKDEEFWLGLIKQFFLDQPCSEILGIPSIEESKRLADEETSRLEKQFNSFTKEQLDQFDEKLRLAKEYNERPIPKEYFEKIKTPSPDSISFYSILSVRDDKSVHQDNEKLFEKEEKLREHLMKSNETPLPFSNLFSHVQSQFINIRFGFNTQNIPDDQLRELLPLYLELLTMSSAKKDDGTLITFEQIDKLILKYTIDFKTSIGLSTTYEGGDFGQFCIINTNFEKKYYNDIVELLKLLLNGIIIEPERIKIVVKKLLDDIPHRKEDGQKMVKSLVQYSIFTKEKTNSIYLNYQKQTNILQNILQILGDDNDEDEDGVEKVSEEKESKPIELTKDVLSLVSRLNQIKDYFSKNAQEMFVSVGGNLFELNDPKGPWIKEFSYLYKDPSKPSTLKFSKSVFHYDLLDDFEKNKGKILAVVTPGNGSSGFQRIIKSNFTYDNIISLEYLSLFLAINYLEQLEGSFWRELRGTGYLYSYKILTNVESGYLSFKASRVSNAEKVLEVCRDIIKRTLSEPLDSIWLSGAKSSAVYEITNKEENFDSTLELAYFDQLRGWAKKNYRDFLPMSFKVTESDIKNSIKKYLEPLFDDSQSCIVFTSDSSKIELFKKDHPNTLLIDPEEYYN